MRKTLLTTLFLLCLFGVARAQKADYGGRVSIDANAVNVKPQFSTFKSVKKHAPMRDASVVFFDDFESGSLSQWTIYTEGGAPFADGWCTFDMNDPNFDNSFDAHSGHYVASAWSWNGSSYNADNWLVTPQVALGGTLKFWVVTHPNYPDSYEVKLSTAGNAVADFTVTLQDMAPALTADHGEWKEVTIDLSAYAGQQGYIAIHHQDYDMNYLFIDDFGIYAEEGGGGSSTIYDFEDGDIPTAFVNDATYPWFATADAEAGFNGTYCAMTSNAGQNSTTSALELTVDYTEDGTISFKALCKGEGSSTAWDKCEFYIDDAVQFTYGASVTGWNDYIYDVAAGSHTFKWSYTKDSSVNPTGDYMAIDDVTITMGSVTPPSPTVETPTNVQVSDITDNSAKVTWDGTGDSFTFRYRSLGSVTPGDGNWYSYDEGASNEDAIGTGGGQFYWGIMLPAGSYIGDEVQKVAAYDYMAMTGTVTIYNDGDTAPENAVGTMAVEFTGANDWAEFTFDTPVAIDNTKNVWVVFYNESGATYPAAVCANSGDANGRWVSLDGSTWDDLVNYGLDYSFMVKAYIGTAATAPDMAKRTKHVISMLRKAKDAWTVGSTAENFVELTGLDPETLYEVQVQATAGSQTSEWSDAEQFTTLAAATPVNAPTDLTVSDITATSATVTWNGDADGYEMELGVAGGEEPASYDFSDGTLQGWTNIQVNTDGGLWLHSDNNPGAYDYSAFMDGNGFAMCYSYIDYDGAYDTDAYLVSPQAFDIVAGSELTFKANQANAFYPESFSVCVAETTGTPTAADFTVVATPTVSTGYDDTPTEISVDLSAYAGKSIWIAFHDQNYDGYEIWIDDIAISGAKKRAITWTPVGDVTSPYNLTGLDPETEYSVRVRGVSGSTTSDWVATTFTTLAAPAVAVPTDLAISDITATSAVATWTGSNDTYTLRYRPVEDALPGAGSSFSVDFESGMPEGWTTIDADGDGYDWMLASDVMGTGYGHNGSDDCILSQSYDNTDGVLYPDNYLVSPKVAIANGSTFSFYACGQDASYANEHFGVAVSTTSNSDASAFTTLNEWTMTAAPGMKKGPGKNGAPNRVQGNWYQYSVDLSAYAGQEVYIAIRHFNCTDMFYLDVDDIALTSDTKDAKKAPRREAAEWTTLDVAEATAELTGLEPETTYEVQVQGVTGGEVSDWTDVVTFTTLAAPAVEVPTDLAISEITSESAVATWSGTTDTYNIRYREVTASTDAVTVTLTTDDVWGDGSGYQMLLDADANAFGSVIPETGALTTGGDVDESIYAEFEYKIPENADGALTTSNIVLDNSVSIEIPAGTYDWCITNPTPGDRMWIGSAQGNVGGRADDYTFEAGKVYEFHVYISGNNDATDVTITDARGAAEWTTVEDVTSPYSLTGLTAETEYEVQVQGVTGGVASDWSASVLFTTTEATGINGLKVAGQENWYTIDGRKLAKRPTTAGVYILNGSKVIVK